MSMIDGVDVVWMTTSDMDRAVNFYRDILGLPVTYTSPYWSSVQCGSCSIGIHAGGDGTPAPRGWTLCLVASDLKALKAQLQQAGVWIADELHETPRGMLMDFQDPDGSTLQAIQLGSTPADF